MGEIRNDLLQKLQSFAAYLWGKGCQASNIMAKRARLVTKPLATGSISCVMTMGTVTVASLATRVTIGPPVTITSTLRFTSSAAISRR